jgi:superfamily II DNA/RNA helicase
MKQIECWIWVFGIQIDRILKYIPKERQTLMFSATLPEQIVKLSKKYLTNPERVSIGKNKCRRSEY